MHGIRGRETMKDCHFSHFNIAGFTYYEGAEIFEQLAIGTLLTMRAEPENGFDPYAVEIYFQKFKLGYIPRNRNQDIHKFLTLGHDDLFVVRINRLSPDEHPEQQIGVVVKIRAKG